MIEGETGREAADGATWETTRATGRGEGGENVCQPEHGAEHVVGAVDTPAAAAGEPGATVPVEESPVVSVGRSGIALFALLAGIAGIVLGRVPLVGRFASLVCGALAMGAGGIGMHRTQGGIRGSRHNLAVAGLALGGACVFEGALGFITSALGSAILGFATSLG